MRFEEFFQSYKYLINHVPCETADKNKKYVILSDLHLGDGGPKDDLRHNKYLIESLLYYYLQNDYSLILNGDIEDLNKFSYPDIRLAWDKLFGIFHDFHQEKRLIKIAGNHDLALLNEHDYPFPLHDGFVLNLAGKKIFMLHGHQSSDFFLKYGYLSEYIVKYLLKPLSIKNSSVSESSKRSFSTEKLFYQAARRLGILTIIGHTHRPLFESLSKYDSIRWKLEHLVKKKKNTYLSRNLYSTNPFLVPCLFNSGCATGRHGITALEIEPHTISLIHWGQDPAIKSFIKSEALTVTEIHDRIFRHTLKRDKLARLFLLMELVNLAKVV
ncbi:MAG: metallophosphoesterase family protein [Spirochaetaceae bacterium]|jgi:UDP-2,3-diacylglucosamine pyrophosphatase LpxH|nr:metallophosphoesterase family protein [Spirochaetaceae bacterium]